MTAAEMLKAQMRKKWSSFSDEELYRVFCLLIDQIEILEKQNKTLKKKAEAQLRHSDASEFQKIEILKSHIGHDAIKIIEETEKASKSFLDQTAQAIEKIRKESEKFEREQMKIREEIQRFLELKFNDFK